MTGKSQALDAPRIEVPPLLAGVRGPKSLALAGRVADGVVLAEGAGPTYVSQSIAAAGHPDPFRVSVFTALGIHDDAAVAHRIMAPFVADMLGGGSPAVLAHPHIDEIEERFHRRGVDGIAEMPGDWWVELGARTRSGPEMARQRCAERNAGGIFRVWGWENVSAPVGAAGSRLRAFRGCSSGQVHHWSMVGR